MENLKSQIANWLMQYPYWLQFSGKALLDGENLNEELINATYELFLEDEGLKPSIIVRQPILFEIEESSQIGEDDLRLIEVKDIQNVNALATGQIIPFHNNLTVIFGANGVGKSGYVRLFNRAFNSRGDKRILNNVYATVSNGEASCKFVFKVGDDKQYELLYPENKGSREFNKFAIFDTECARAHIQEENKLLFTPRGFEFFDQLITIFENIKERLSVEIGKNKKENEFVALFKNDNEIRDIIHKLNFDSDLNKINNLKDYDNDEREALRKLNLIKSELTLLNIPLKITEAQKKYSLVESFLLSINLIQDKFSKKNLEDFWSYINTYKDLQQKSSVDGVNALNDLNIGALGSKEWREFIISAKNYIAKLSTEGEVSPDYPVEGDKCIFCLQDLRQSENDIVNKYWQYLKSEYERSLEVISKNLGEIKNRLQNLSIPELSDDSVVLNCLAESDVKTAARWKAIVLKFLDVKGQLIKICEEKAFVEFDIPFEDTQDLKDLLEKFSIEIENLRIKNPANELVEIEKQIQFLNDKLLLNNLHNKILLYVNQLQWAEKAGRSLNGLRTNFITTKQGQLFSEHITSQYTQTFKKECEFLKAPASVDISQRNIKGQTLRKLQIAGQTANSVLSEGEQRSICLSDFLTEVQLNHNNRGVIFDDPVTSLDHERKEIIATRLVQESNRRQVIIFTHDISFLIYLQLKSENQQIGFSVTTLRKFGSKVGIVNQSMPWIAQKVKDRVGYLKNDLVRIKKLEKEERVDEYNYAVKSWYGLLREGWERSVEERLFKGVVERFNLGIQTQKLKNVAITEEFIQAIEQGMSESSKWVHDTSPELNTTFPNSNKLNEDLLFFENFTKKCVSA
ncbi:AAA family ATPase [Rufibacter roseus]|uniref:AAA family ATPase n=1 Tax=Rufibacter roseus TaxID=1567108 RepID=A0ABW2DLQ3_9BACT|nr:AAA family ATPase [Rufibacter roseus]